MTGANEDFIGLLLFMHWDNCREFLGRSAVTCTPAQLSADPRLRQYLREAMATMARSGGSSTFPARVLIEVEAPVADAGEITDKGYINQRAVLEHRAAEVSALYEQVHERVIRL